MSDLRDLASLFLPLTSEQEADIARRMTAPAGTLDPAAVVRLLMEAQRSPWFDSQQGSQYDLAMRSEYEVPRTRFRPTWIARMVAELDGADRDRAEWIAGIKKRLHLVSIGDLMPADSAALVRDGELPLIGWRLS